MPIKKFGDEDREARKRAIVKLVVLIVVGAAIFAIYRYAMTTPFFVYVMAAYFVGFAALLFGYIIYNRGLPRKDLTADDLPDEWSQQKKEEFIGDGKRRQKRSQWMLIPMLGFIFTFAMELLELFALPFIEKMLGE